MIYLDSAATTLQKPAQVSRAVLRTMQHAASPGRGGHRAAQIAAAVTYDCRETAADLFGLSDPEQVVFTMNATHALNLAIHSVVRPGDRVVISGYEHNAVTRPLYAMDGVDVRVAHAPLFQPELQVAAIEQCLREGAQAVICTHVSNVFGYVLPMDDIARLCRSSGVPLIVDASQSAGCLDVNIGRWQAAFVAMPGHKGLYGPQGTGLLLCGAPVTPLLFGGTGSRSLEQTMPEFLPDRLEAGTHNVPGIAGLLAGLRFIRSRGVEQICAHEQRLIRLLSHQLKQISGVEVFAAPEHSNCQSGVLSFRVNGADHEQLGTQLAERGFAVRAGLHCAPLAHGTAGTLPGGTIRVSVSAFNTPDHIHRFSRTLTALAAG